MLQIFLSHLTLQLLFNKSFIASFLCKKLFSRKAHPNFSRHRFLTGRPNALGVKDVTWLHPKGHEMGDDDWNRQHLHAFGMLLHGDRLHSTDPQGNPLRDETFLVLFNAGDPASTIILPSASAYDDQGWIEVIDAQEDPLFVAGQRVQVLGHSIRVFMADPSEDDWE